MDQQGVWEVETRRRRGPKPNTQPQTPGQPKAVPIKSSKPKPQSQVQPRQQQQAARQQQEPWEYTGGATRRGLKQKKDLARIPKGQRVAPYNDRRLVPVAKGGDPRWREGSTFLPPAAGTCYPRPEEEPLPHVAPSCMRYFHGRVIDRKDEVAWGPQGTCNNNRSYVNPNRDIREFGNICSYGVMQHCIHCGSGSHHWSDYCYKRWQFEKVHPTHALKED